MAGGIKIDIETNKGYSGLGDIVTLAWLAEACRETDHPLAFHRLRNFDLMAMFDLTVDPRPGGIALDEAYRRELADQCRRPRLDYIRDQMGIAERPAQPRIILPATAGAWADDQIFDLGGPPVLLFPQSAWPAREWPASYWVDLAWKLRNANIPSVVMLSNEDKRFASTPLYWWGTPLPRVAALVAGAALVVGNDSLPAHLAGTLGVPTIALMGPTRPNVFAHAPSVTCIQTRRIECTGCHFSAPFRAACDQGCQSLFRIYAEEVFTLITRALRAGPLPVPG